VSRLKGASWLVGGCAAVAALMLTPALASPSSQRASLPRPSITLSAGNFTPSIADPRLAAEFARRGIQGNSFRFTPPAASADKSNAVKVAVRARSTTAGAAARTSTEAASAITAITPTAYNLGVSVGWKRFAISGDIARVDGGTLPGSSEAAEVGVSYAANKFTGRVALGAERADPERVRIVPVESSYSLDVGGSYAIDRNLAVTGGVRYKIQRDRLEPLADERRDSQAVYLGTAFRF
jgi:hypothetical protein